MEYRKKNNRDPACCPGKIYFRIAGHLLRLSYARALDLQAALPSFRPFAEVHPGDQDPICSVTLHTGDIPELSPRGTLLSTVSPQWGDRFSFRETESTYITRIRSQQGPGLAWMMCSDKDFGNAEIYTRAENVSAGGMLSWLLMLAYGQAVLPFKTVLMHASVVMNREQGYAFLGKSGTGKSTHSRLWLENIPGSVLLNDDNPVVRIDSTGQARVYGSPWSGKTHCYKNASAKLCGIVRLKQAEKNHWQDLDGKQALMHLLPSCTSVRWNRSLYNHMVDTAQSLVAGTPTGLLECLPDRDAAVICHAKLTQLNTSTSESKTTHNEQI